MTSKTKLQNLLESHFEDKPFNWLEVNDDCDIPSTLLTTGIKISSADKFYWFIDKITEIDFPHLFGFMIHVDNFEDDELAKIKEKMLERFGGRLMVLECVDKNNKSQIFFKENGDFKVYAEGVSDTESEAIPRLKISFETIVNSCLKFTFPEKFQNCIDEIKNLKKANHSSSSENSTEMKKLVELLGLSSKPDVPFSDATIELVTFQAMGTGTSILGVAIKEENEKVVSLLLSNFEKYFDKWDLEYKQKLTKIAYEKESSHEIFLALIKSNFPFPQGHDWDGLMRKFENHENTIIKDQKCLHDTLKGGDENKVMEIIDDFYKGESEKIISSHLYDPQNVSLLSKAFEFCKNRKDVLDESQRYYLYVHLKVRGLTAGIDEKRIKNEILESKNNINTQISDLILSLGLPLYEEYVNKLTKKSKVYDRGIFSVKLRQLHSAKIKTFFRDLCSVPIMEHIMRVIAESSLNVSFHFDFSQTHIHEIILEKIDSVWNILGEARPSGTIIIGAKDNKKALRTLAHEMTHLAMLIVYKNSFLPYSPHEKIIREKFENIVKEYQAKHPEGKSNIVDPSDGIVPNVFTYKGAKYERTRELWCLELIVRVPEMVVNFWNTPQLQECKKTYGSLFKFFNNKTLKDLENYKEPKKIDFEIMSLVLDQFSLTDIEVTGHKIEMKKIVQIIETNEPKIALGDIRQHMLSKFGSMERSNLLIVTAQQLNSLFQVNSLIYKNYKKLINVTVVVDISEVPLVNVQAELSAIHIEKSNYIIVTSCTETSEKASEYFRENGDAFEKSDVKYSWGDLTDETKKKVFKKLIKFQNYDVHLSSLVNSKTVTPELGTRFLSFCLQEKELIVNAIKKLPDSYIKRKFAKLSYKTLTEEEIESVPKDELFKYDFIPGNNKSDGRILKVESTTLKENEIVNQQAENSKYFLISSESGSGKSVVLRKLAEYISELPGKFDLPNMVYIIDLNNYIKEFKTIPISSFKDFFLKIFLHEKSEFEKLIFEYFYTNKKVFILFDGFDEISPICKEKVLTLIKSFNGHDGSQIWITTRPHLETELRQELNVDVAYKLEPFNRINQIKFLTDYWKSVEMKSDKSYENTANELITRASNGSEKMYELLSNPQTLKLFADACLSDHVLDEQFVKRFTKFSIYQKAISNQIQVWSAKETGKVMNSQAQINYSNFVDPHHNLAFKCYSIDIESIFGVPLRKFWTNDEIMRCGIIKNLVNKENPIFKHESWKEYFVADYIVKGLCNLENWKYFEEIFELLIKFLQSISEYNVICMFISGGLKSFEAEKFSDSKIKKLAEALEVIVTKNDVKFLTNSGNYVSLYELLLKVFKKMSFQTRRNQLIKELHPSVSNIPYMRRSNFIKIFEEIIGNSTDYELNTELNNFKVLMESIPISAKSLKEIVGLLTILPHICIGVSCGLKGLVDSMSGAISFLAS